MPPCESSPCSPFPPTGRRNIAAQEVTEIQTTSESVGTRAVRDPRIYTLAAVAVYVAWLVAEHTVQVVRVRGLLPRWDLATHVGHGWLDYHFLVTGQIHRLVADLWMQGYWPPGHSLYLLPFFLTLGGTMTSALWGSVAVFVLVCLTGMAICRSQWGDAGWLAAALFVSLMCSSPYVLAYGSVAMTELLGALAQLLVLCAYVHYRQAEGPRTARLFAISLTVLFFVKYNYLALLAAPLLIHEALQRTAGMRAREKVAIAWAGARRTFASPTMVLLILYTVAVLAIVGSGGFQFDLLGRRVSVRSIGNSGLIVFYALLLRVWYLSRRGRIDWARIIATEPRVGPLLTWFVVPVAVWLASPHPNHIKDVANLLINRPVGMPSVGAGVTTYLDALRDDYFSSPWVLAIVVTAFVIAAARYRRQPALMQLLVVAVPLQLAAVALHQTRFTRFLLPSVVLLCLAAAGEVGTWIGARARSRILSALLFAVLIVVAAYGGRRAVAGDRFREIAFEHYTDSSSLRSALASVRGGLTATDRLAIVGQTNDLSPALFRWELGPPSGVPCFPFEVAGANRLEPVRATQVLLLDALGAADAPLDAAPHYAPRAREVVEAAGRGEFTLDKELPLPDLGVRLRLYRRTTAADPAVPCR